MKKKLSEYSFLQVFLFTGGIFLVIVLLIEFIYLIAQMPFNEAIAALADPNYLMRKLVATLIYALIMTFYFRRKRKKND